MTNAKSYCMVITRTICTVAHDLVLWIRISCHLLVRNHINVVYVTSVLKKIIDVNRYLRRHTWDKPYQSSNCDIIKKICIHKWYVKNSVGDWDSLYMKHLKMYTREKHISATIIIWPYVKLHISIFIFNENIIEEFLALQQVNYRNIWFTKRSIWIEFAESSLNESSTNFTNVYFAPLYSPIDMRDLSEIYVFV